MTSISQNSEDCREESTPKSLSNQEEEEKILCPHCRRTASNGIKCKGICVADSDY